MELKSCYMLEKKMKEKEKETWNIVEVTIKSNEIRQKWQEELGWEHYTLYSTPGCQGWGLHVWTAGHLKNIIHPMLLEDVNMADWKKKVDLFFTKQETDTSVTRTLFMLFLSAY